MTSKDYCKFLLIHFILLDTTNARYLWKRLPKKLKEDDKLLTHLWAIGKELSKKNYPQAMTLIDTPTKQAEVDALLKVLARVLREIHLLRNIQKAYSSIELNKLKQILGYKNDSDVQKLLQEKQWIVQDGHVHPTR